MITPVLESKFSLLQCAMNDFKTLATVGVLLYTFRGVCDLTGGIAGLLKSSVAK
jgi:hypothetical protein